MEMMPEGTGYADLRHSVYALLKLSELVCERAGLTRWQPGAAYPRNTLPPKLTDSHGRLRRNVGFTESEIEQAGISLQHLMGFVLNPNERAEILNESLENTRFERHPVLWRDKEICLALPTGVSAAIRRYLIERVDAAGLRADFIRALGVEYSHLFADTPLLGDAFHAPISFEHWKSGAAAVVVRRVDIGRYVTFVFILDTLAGIESSGIAGLQEITPFADDRIVKTINEATIAVQEDANFREGTALIVSCGVGRSLAGHMPWPNDPRWRTEFVSAPDLITMSWTKGFSPLTLWRLHESEKKIAELGVALQNINGLLNLVAWQRKLRGHLVPHSQIPDDFVVEGHEALLMIDQAALKSLRWEVADGGDPHVERYINGQWTMVRRMNDSRLAGDSTRPLYVGVEFFKTGCLPIAYLAPHRAWWCEIVVTPRSSKKLTYERWRMLGIWLSRMAPVLDPYLRALPAGPVLWRVQFEADLAFHLDDRPRTGLEAAKEAIAVDIDKEGHTVSLRVGEAFEGAHFNVENVAERALVERALDGFLMLASTAYSEELRAALLARIVPSPQARQTHAFRTHGFRDQVEGPRSSAPVFIHQDDSADLRLGLGWRVRSRDEGQEILGKENCTKCLNAATRLLEDELSTEISQFNRAQMVGALLLNHEQAAKDRDQWKRTASAVVALHDDKKAAFTTIAEHEVELNGVFQASRTLVELAQCVCPIVSGLEPGELDLSRLMARMAMIIHLGGWSDAMWYDAMEPRIHLNSLGDIQINHSFIATVIEPFGRSVSDERTKEAIASYADNLEEIVPPSTVEDGVEEEFHDALRQEWGAGVDEARLFLDRLEDFGIRQNELVFTLSRNSLIEVLVTDGGLAQRAAEQLIAATTLPLRTTWHEVPPGYDERDRQPWKFRRRLSALRKPLIQLDDVANPTLMVAPGLVRDGFIYALGNYHRGDFPQWQLGPKMRKWRGKASATRGHAFNAEVAKRMHTLGWEARSDVKVSAVLGGAFGRLGDIDVLAWNSKTGGVLLMECKDLKFSKTLGEIAEQLLDFRGELRDGYPDDLLKHLTRVEALRAQPEKLAGYIGLRSITNAEAHIIFRHPVPMQFAWDRMKQRIQLHVFDELEHLCQN